MSKPFKVLSWGGGTQSTALGEMSASGDIERLDAILISNPGFERRRTYEIMRFYTERWNQMGIYTEVINAGDIRVDGGREHRHIPFRTVTGGLLNRQCTGEFKIMPVRRRIRTLLGFHPHKAPHPAPGTVEQWIGFSWDEYYRMKDNKRDPKYIIKRYPLIEMKLNRWDSINYLEEKKLPIPPRSACLCCPYRSAGEWLELKQEDPDDWAQSIQFDNENRTNPFLSRCESDYLYLYKRLVPLQDADLEADAAAERKGTQIPLLVCNDSQCWT